MEPWDFIKSLVLYLSVHMELSHCQSFYHRPSLGGYTVGTKMGFPVEIVEAIVKSRGRAYSTIWVPILLTVE
jgi:hypothetical protein